ncbi:hypothetical protein HanPSC8_Chr16g0696871 [Helianthus annuus]|nr:hypothetical protein HanPSC8_Chr16g0696871 [Helianthus annuus]
MLTFTKRHPPDPEFPSATSPFFDELFAMVFLRKDRIGGHPTTWL